MALGYEGDLYILAFDHRGSFQKKFFGIDGAAGPEDTLKIIDAKTVIFEGLRRALADGVSNEAAGVLVDEQFGAEVARAATRDGLKLAMPAEKSGQHEFDFEYGEEFSRAHRGVRSRLHEGARALQPRRRRRDERPPGRSAEAAVGLAASHRAPFPVRAARPRRTPSAGDGRPTTSAGSTGRSART